MLGQTPRPADWTPAPRQSTAYEFAPLPEAAAHVPPALARVPGGTFLMGNSFNNLYPAEGYAKEVPVHAVPVTAFFVGRFEITNEEMARTLQWAYGNGLVEVAHTVTTNGVTNFYGTVHNTEGTQRELLNLDGAYCQIAFTNGAFWVAAGKSNFPCIYVTWHGALAFCNYLSDREGLPRAVDFAPPDWSVDISAAGYRLPTEAEWEKACRGGIPGTHFPWPDDSVQGTNNYAYSIDPAKANYADLRYGSPANHPMHPWFSEAVRTTPVGYYDGSQVITNLSTNIPFRGADFGQTNDMANGYGLYDMAGNVYEWCLDYLGTNWYANPAALLPDPTGPAAETSYMTQRVARGGGFAPFFFSQPAEPSFQRCAFRNASYSVGWTDVMLGFRVVRRLTAYETWAVAQGLDPLAANGQADGDRDEDGQSNYGEYVADTQPTNPASFFRVAGVGPVAATVAAVYWGVSGRVYTVEGVANPAQTNAWEFLAAVTNATTGDSQIAVPATEARQFLRIKAKLAP